MNIRHYRNPPIAEAICEVELAPGDDKWNISYPWLFYEKIKNTYTGTPREQKLLRLESSPKKSLEKDTPPPRILEQQSKTQFPLEDDTGLVAVAPYLLSAHVKEPYPGWDVFRARIAEAIKEYLIITKLNGIRRVGLRYVNKIMIPEPRPNLADYFTTPPALILDGLPVDNFHNHNEYIYQDEPIRVVLNFARAESPPEVSAYLLDIDLIWQWPAEPLPIESTMNRIDELRRRERIVFEKLITDRSRGLFDAT